MWKLDQNYLVRLGAFVAPSLLELPALQNFIQLPVEGMILLPPCLVSGMSACCSGSLVICYQLTLFCGSWVKPFQPLASLYLLQLPRQAGDITGWSVRNILLGKRVYFSKMTQCIETTNL